MERVPALKSLPCDLKRNIDIIYLMRSPLGAQISRDITSSVTEEKKLRASVPLGPPGTAQIFTITV